MAEITRVPVARVGVDLSKRVYQVHAVDRSGRVVLAKPLSPDRFFVWCAGLPPRQNSCRPDRTDGPDGFQVLVVDGGRRLWSLWAKAGAVGNA